jgi:hypothetical protein
MGSFNPLDPIPERWGWPWHGLMTVGTGSRVDTAIAGAVMLPSGRKVDCKDYGGNFTYLWDIGMPAPAPLAAPADPDEQWLNQAILRGSSAGIGPLYAYGGLSAEPVRLGSDVGSGFLRARWAANVATFTYDALYLSEAGPLTSMHTLTLTRAQLGLDGVDGDGSYSPNFQLMDRSKDGTALLIGCERNGLAAIIEVLIAGTFDAVAATITVLAKGADVVPSCVIRSRAPEYPPITGDGRASGAVGTFHGDSEIGAVVWAWYTPAGVVDFVRYKITHISTETISISSSALWDGTVDWSLSVTYTMTLNCAAGAVSSVLAQSVTQHDFITMPESHSAWLETHDKTVSVVLDGVPLVAQSYNLTYTAADMGSMVVHNGAWQPFWFRDAREPFDITREYIFLFGQDFGSAGAVTSPLCFARLSNKIVALRMALPSVLSVPSSPQRLTYGDALTPTGIHAGRYSHVPDAYTPFGMDMGAYNPITGAVSRHRPTAEFTYI